VPVVVQNLFVVLAGLLLGPVDGPLAVLLFLGLGALGFPVFSGGHGGLAVLVGPTGGYLAGYLVAALLAGILARGRRLVTTMVGSVAAFLAILALGCAGLMLLRNVSLAKALAVGVLPFLIGDGLKCVLAVLVAMKLGPFTDSLRGRSPRA
jgi:biotin transport system substrate-specific component